MGCGNGTKVKDDPFLFRNHYPMPVRIMVGIFGCVLLAIPYFFLIAPGWNHFSWLLIPYGLLGIAGGIGGILFLLSSILGEARESRLDFNCQQLVQTSRGIWFNRVETRTPFADITILEMSKPNWATEEAVFTLTPVLDNGDSLPSFGSFPSKDEAEKIRMLMGHLAQDGNDIAKGWSKAELAALQQSMQARSNCTSGACGCGPTLSTNPTPESKAQSPNPGLHLVH